MALVKCPECGKKVSSTVDRCIHCGYDLSHVEEFTTLIVKKEKNAKLRGAIITIVVLLVLFGVAFGLYMHFTKELREAYRIKKMMEDKGYDCIVSTDNIQKEFKGKDSFYNYVPAIDNEHPDMMCYKKKGDVYTAIGMFYIDRYDYTYLVKTEDFRYLYVASNHKVEKDKFEACKHDDREQCELYNDYYSDFYKIMREKKVEYHDLGDKHNTIYKILDKIFKDAL